MITIKYSKTIYIRFSHDAEHVINNDSYIIDVVENDHMVMYKDEITIEIARFNLTGTYKKTGNCQIWFELVQFNVSIDFYDLINSFTCHILFMTIRLGFIFPKYSRIIIT